MVIRCMRRRGGVTTMHTSSATYHVTGIASTMMHAGLQSTLYGSMGVDALPVRSRFGVALVGCFVKAATAQRQVYALTSPHIAKLSSVKKTNPN